MVKIMEQNIKSVEFIESGAKISLGNEMYGKTIGCIKCKDNNIEVYDDSVYGRIIFEINNCTNYIIIKDYWF